MNIERYGNTVAASCPLVFDELRRAGRIQAGQKVMFLAFGAGLTWGRASGSCERTPAPASIVA
ncbi:MAG: 3-oxoacyl-[acyl-carrier-protein] synthase III C-terminal domain-containing protein [Phycisphaerales bacterium]